MSSVLDFVLIFGMLHFSSAGLNTAPFAKRKTRQQAHTFAATAQEKRSEDVSSVSSPQLSSESAGLIDLSVVGCYQDESELLYLDPTAPSSDFAFTYSESAFLISNVTLVSILILSTLLRWIVIKTSRSTDNADPTKLSKFATMYVPSSRPDLGPNGAQSNEGETRARSSSTGSKDTKTASKPNIKVLNSKTPSVNSRKKDADAEKSERNSKDRTKQTDRSSESGITRKAAAAAAKPAR